MAAIKEQAIEMIRALPDDATWEDMMEEIYFRMQVEDGLAQADRGETVPHEEVVARMAKWLS